MWVGNMLPSYPYIFFLHTPSLADMLGKKKDFPPSLMRFFYPIILQETNFFNDLVQEKIGDRLWRRQCVVRVVIKRADENDVLNR